MPKTTKKVIFLYPPHLNFIDHFINDKGMASTSEVIRNALTFYHDKTYPDYIFRLSPAALEKKIKRQEKTKKEEMSNEEYAQSIKAPVVEGPDGAKWVIVAAWHGTVRSIKLDNLKSVMEDNDELLLIHKEYVAINGSVEAKFVDDEFPRGANV